MKTQIKVLQKSTQAKNHLTNTWQTIVLEAMACSGIPNSAVIYFQNSNLIGFQHSECSIRQLVYAYKEWKSCFDHHLLSPIICSILYASLRSQPSCLRSSLEPQDNHSQ